ncbi:MAG: hypothetical protein C0599_01955 [Salinivirgaceae bacterium]|nr:MAG: hypothetical protein C0599_01955 [Salinivirgaceae bacterium]
MKQFLNYFKDFHKSYFDIRLYGTVLLFLASLITINYYFDIEDTYIDSFRGSFWRIPLFFLYHGFAYFGVLFILYLFTKNKNWLTKKFLLKSLVGLSILAIDRSVFPFISDPILDIVPQFTITFTRKILNNVYGWFTIALVLFIIKFIFDRHEKFGLYGLKFKNVNFKAYLVLMGIMAIIVFVASQFPHFTDYYPLYKKSGAKFINLYYQVPEVYTKIIYELFYVTDFFNTELLFRGFFIIGMAKLLGKDAVLPMVATYVVLHFGKPMGETISSIFGGYILGILALYSKNIWGGIFLHGGTAFLMEIFAFLKK